MDLNNFILRSDFQNIIPGDLVVAISKQSVQHLSNEELIAKLEGKPAKKRIEIDVFRPPEILGSTEQMEFSEASKLVKVN